MQETYYLLYKEDSATRSWRCLEVLLLLNEKRNLSWWQNLGESWKLCFSSARNKRSIFLKTYRIYWEVSSRRVQHGTPGWKGTSYQYWPMLRPERGTFFQVSSISKGREFSYERVGTSILFKYKKRFFKWIVSKRRALWPYHFNTSNATRKLNDKKTSCLSDLFVLRRYVKGVLFFNGRYE